MDGITLVNGYTLATLACEYVEAISKPGAVPDLDQGWQAVVCLEVKQYCDKLVGEYKTEMEELLQHNMPMEESRLMRLHHEALCGKKKAFEEEIHRVSPVYSTDRKIFPLIHELEREIVQWNDEGKPVVVGRVLFHFLTENYAVSKEHCKKVFSDLLKESEIEAKTNTAILDSQPFNIGEEISVISARYNTMALGPAATGVMERGQLELQQLRDTLKMIPGKPCNLKYVGISTDRIKLSWDPPFYNTDAVESFIVLRRAEGEEWEEVKRTENTKALITGLKSNTNYTFQVRATNALIESIENEGSYTTDKLLAWDAKHARMGAKCYHLPAFINLSWIAGRGGYNSLVPAGKVARGATLPISILLAPITAPLGAVLAVNLLKKFRKNQQDLTEE